MTRTGPLPDDLGARFRVRSALELGVHEERMRRGDLFRPFHGVRSTVEPTSVSDLVHAYLPLLPDRGFFSHTTAAALWGLPVPAGLGSSLHVSYPHGSRPARGRGVAGHHLVIRADEITELHGIPLTTPERTWCDLAAVIGFESLIAAGDRAIWRRDPLTSVEAIVDMAHRHPDRRFRRRRDAALPWLCDRSDSSPETVLRVRIIRAGLPTPTVNADIFDGHGRFLGRPDLAFVEYRELVDYEGDGHRTSKEQWWNDLARVPRFEAAKWHTHRAAAPDLKHGSRRLILALADSLREKGWQGTLTI